MNTQNSDQDLSLARDSLQLKDQPVWQLTLELTATRKQLKHVQNEINILGEEKSGKAIETREQLQIKISALEHELDERKEALVLEQAPQQ